MHKGMFIKKLTYEDKFDRKYCCYWRRGARRIKRANRRLYRRILNSGLYD